MRLYGYQAGWYFFINDHLGTPQKIVNASGEVVWAGFYQPFGKSWAYPADITNNFRFPGQYYDAETGLHYNWHRYYEPDTGRYITADPIGLEGGINLYAYVMGNPISLIDPVGLSAKVLGTLIKECLESEPCRKAVMTGLAVTVAGLEDMLVSLMGKGGKKNIDNEHVREVQDRGEGDPCQYLRDLYNKTCDKKERGKIKQAMKRFNCDGKDRFE